MRRTDFHYDLPEYLIAQAPLAERSASRLLTLDGASGALADRAFRDLPALIRPGDLLVFNDTRVIPARLFAVKESGGKVELLLERPQAGAQALVHARASKALRPGMVLTSRGGPIRMLEKHGDLWSVELPEAALSFFERHGQMPLPPYIRREPDAADATRYQSLFARHAGAVAAPTASLHFDAPLIGQLDALGAQRAFVTLHVGAGTFQPVRTDAVGAHVMHAEFVEVNAATCEAIAATKARGGRVVAIGTTVVRALESAALEAETRTAPLDLHAGSGIATLRLSPAYRPRIVDGLVSGLHVPGESHFELLSAFAPRALLVRAIALAAEHGLSGHELGDACLVL